MSESVAFTGYSFKFNGDQWVPFENGVGDVVCLERYRASDEEISKLIDELDAIIKRKVVAQGWLPQLPDHWYTQKLRSKITDCVHQLTDAAKKIQNVLAKIEYLTEADKPLGGDANQSNLLVQSWFDLQDVMVDIISRNPKRARVEFVE